MHHIISQTEKDVHRYSHIGLCDVNANVTCNMYMYVYVYVYLYIYMYMCVRAWRVFAWMHVHVCMSYSTSLMFVKCSLFAVFLSTLYFDCPGWFKVYFLKINCDDLYDDIMIYIYIYIYLYIYILHSNMENWSRRTFRSPVDPLGGSAGATLHGISDGNVTWPYETSGGKKLVTSWLLSYLIWNPLNHCNIMWYYVILCNIPQRYRNNNP